MSDDRDRVTEILAREILRGYVGEREVTALAQLLADQRAEAYADGYRAADILADHLEEIAKSASRSAAPYRAARRSWICPTPCDDDCDADCHEAHQPSWKRDHQPDACSSCAAAREAVDRARDSRKKPTEERA